MIKLNELFADTFGFKTFGLYVRNSAQYRACTLSLGYRLDSGVLPSQLKSSSKGFKYDKKDGYSGMVIINTSIFCNPKFTDREVLAIILHEIGHNFSGAIDPVIFAFNLPFRFIYSFSILFDYMTALYDTDLWVKELFASSNITLEQYNKLNDKINRKYPEFKNGVNLFTKYINMFKDLAQDFKRLMSITFVLSKPVDAISTVLHNMLRRLGYGTMLLIPNHRDEKIADSFATMYGYGADLSSALTKFNSDELFFSGNLINAPIIGSIYNLLMIPIEFIVHLFDEHPNEISRINSQLQYCNKEISEANLDPKLEIELRQNIRDIEKYLIDMNLEIILKLLQIQWL